MKFKELNDKNSTIVFFEEKEYRTTQNPFVNNDGTLYIAHAVDELNEEYFIEWEITHPDSEDESETCDWKNPVNVISL
ncbi:hypothetical protein C6Y02_16815 [Bacillus sp. NMCC4]|uniref:hypothetical protein n=1 Tax=Bacillus sp. NMCC4 TaxID=2108539 RepID=UPI000D02DD6B|nr:hypothetical protein [Bacillus sp. NMCC4]PRS35675.1 hypothetical protein C6Y02_16815 [Bacillus sp. NMCC4]